MRKVDKKHLTIVFYNMCTGRVSVHIFFGYFVISVKNSYEIETI